MKVTVNETKAEGEIKYPCLMISNLKTIVFFAGECEGMVLKTTSTYKMGYLSKSWGMGDFKPFRGTITLEND